jgi:hypothetical protein
MIVRMLTAMAGDSFSYLPGDDVTVPDAVGKVWKEESLAEDPPRAAASDKAAKDLAAQLADVQAQLADANADREALRGQVAALSEANASLTAKLQPAS